MSYRRHVARKMTDIIVGMIAGVALTLLFVGSILLTSPYLRENCGAVLETAFMKALSEVEYATDI